MIIIFIVGVLSGVVALKVYNSWSEYESERPKPIEDEFYVGPPDPYALEYSNGTYTGYSFNDGHQYVPQITEIYTNPSSSAPPIEQQPPDNSVQTTITKYMDPYILWFKNRKII